MLAQAWSELNHLVADRRAIGEIDRKRSNIVTFIDTHCHSRGKSVCKKALHLSWFPFIQRESNHGKQAVTEHPARLGEQVASEQQSLAIQARVSLIIALEDRETNAKCKEGHQCLSISFVCAAISRGKHRSWAYM